MMKQSKCYKHPEIALCKECGGKGKVYLYDELNDVTLVKTCPECKGSGRVKRCSIEVTTTKPFVVGKDDGERLEMN